MSVSFQYPELLVLSKDLSKASRDIKDDALGVAKEVISKVESTAKQLAPRDSGTMANSISSEAEAGGGYVTAEAGPTERYAVFVEFGTYKDAPQAFMGPALDRHSAEWEERLAEKAADIL